VSRRSFVTPLIVAVLVAVATGVTFSTAGSSPAPVAGAARTSPEIPVTGVIVGRGLRGGTAADLSDAFPGWTIEVGRQRASAPVVVVALRSSARRWRPYLLRYAADVLPARTTVVFQSMAADRADSPGQARRTAALLARDASPRRRG
jgi:hypothetical protein